MELDFKEMIRMEINSTRTITVDGLGEVKILKVPRGWVYYVSNTATFVPERDKRPALPPRRFENKHWEKPQSDLNK